MEKHEFDEMKTMIGLEYSKKLSELAENYSKSNNPVKEGDIITDHVGSIKVESITYDYFAFSSNYPSCIYHGIEVKKDGTSMKRHSERDVYQGNLKSINNKEI